MRKFNRAALVVTGVLAATGTGLLGTTAHADNSPPSPPGVGADGSVNLNEAPRQVPVVGPDGSVVTDPSGRAQEWQSRIDELPPPPGRARPDGLRHKIAKDEKGRTVETIDVPPLRP